MNSKRSECSSVAAGVTMSYVWIDVYTQIERVECSEAMHLKQCTERRGEQELCQRIYRQRILATRSCRTCCSLRVDCVDGMPRHKYRETGGINTCWFNIKDEIGNMLFQINPTRI
jgi:hypothetical protein